MQGSLLPSLAIPSFSAVPSLLFHYIARSSFSLCTLTSSGLQLRVTDMKLIYSTRLPPSMKPTSRITLPPSIFRLTLLCVSYSSSLCQWSDVPSILAERCSVISHEDSCCLTLSSFHSPPYLLARVAYVDPHRSRDVRTNTTHTHRQFIKR
jgi:hypothetical protein